MNALNRVLVVFFLFITMVLCSFVLVMPEVVLDVIAQQSAYLASFLKFDEFTLNWFVQKLVGICVALLLDGILFFFIILELRRPRKAIHVERADGEVLISIASIADRIKHKVGQLPDVLRTKPKVSGKRKGVQVELNVEIEAGVNVPKKAEQIVQVTQQVVEEDMGLTLVHPPKVNLRAASYTKIKSPLAPPKAPPTEPEVVTPAEPQDWSPVEPVEPVEAEKDLPNLPEDVGENL
ncbi:MAG: alkaline shock response membrane anchor protein AmaP [Chloroflexi bacterium]|nr:alkaline shock response membrane anchor protein AmaP [Chloroflexota bacterium]